MLIHAAVFDWGALVPDENEIRAMMKQHAPAGFEPLVEPNVRFVLERESRTTGAAPAALETPTPAAATSSAAASATTTPVVAPTTAAAVAATAATTQVPPKPTAAAVLPENEHTTRALLSLHVTRPIRVGEMLIAEQF